MQPQAKQREQSWGHYAELAQEAQRLADQVEALARENDVLRDALAMSRSIMRDWIDRP